MFTKNVFLYAYTLFCIFRINYGFVTFGYKVDAYDAVENGNNDPSLPNYDLSFGGRRLFCRQRYSDLGTYILSTICTNFNCKEMTTKCLTAFR